MQLNSDLKEFSRLLNSNKVEYLVVGAHAVAHHGYARFTADIDIFIRRSQSNAARVSAALNEFGFASIGITPDDLIAAHQVIQLGVAPNRVDLLTSISGVEFAEAWEQRIAGELGGMPVHYIGRTALLVNKRSTGRAKDLGDVEELERR